MIVKKLQYTVNGIHNLLHHKLFYNNKKEKNSFSKQEYNLSLFLNKIITAKFDIQKYKLNNSINYRVSINFVKSAGRILFKKNFYQKENNESICYVLETNEILLFLIVFSKNFFLLKCINNIKILLFYHIQIKINKLSGVLKKIEVILLKILH